MYKEKSGGIMKIKANKKVAVFILLIASIVLCTSTAFSKIITNVEPDISAKELRAVVVEDFEKSPQWTVTTTPRQFKDKESNKNPVPVLEWKIVEGYPADLKVEQWSQNNKGLQKEKVFGVNFQFKYPGPNNVHVIPPEPISLPGRAHGISVWVHGRGNNYYMEVWVKDYKGNVHILKFGSINFVGWRPMQVEIPLNIPQEVDSYPQTKTLKIERFVIRSDPSEIVTNTVFFFDQIKVLTETFEVNFDGSGLESNFDSFKENGNTANNNTNTDNAQ